MTPELTPYQSIVMFIRKRDPRYKEHLARASTPAVSEKEKDGTASTAAAAAAQRRNEAGESYVEQDWQRVKHEVVVEAEEHWDEEEEEWVCMACQKVFRSERAWNSHERSKKHLKEVERYAVYRYDY